MNIQNQYITRLASQKKRADGRGIDDYREISIEKDIIPKANGSARVRIGETEVLVGVKFAVGTPFSDRPNEGVLMTGAEFSPLASPNFEQGPPDENCIELARVVDRGIRESGMIDVSKLCIEKREKVWIVNVDIHVMNHRGNLIDAASLGAVTALMNARLPELDKDNNMIYEKITNKKLSVKDKPVAITFASLGEMLVMDPELDEEEAMGTRFTITFTEKGNISAMQKSGMEGLTEDQISDAIDRAEKKSKELRKLFLS